MLTAFLPCRKGSERVPRKNVRPFAGEEGGLLAVKLRQLSRVSGIDRIVVSTNDEDVINVAKNSGVLSLDIDLRREELCTSATSTDALIRYVPEVVHAGDVLWTHVTSPLFDAEHYEEIIARYRAVSSAGTHDSLMTVSALRTFVWDGERPINYDRAVEKWPRTQTLSPLYEINSAAFISPIETYRAPILDRIGERPLLHVCADHTDFDIDWPKDFEVAEALYQNRSVKNG